MSAARTSLRVGGTLTVGALGVLAARALAIPGGAFTGAMLATAAASLLSVPLSEPPKRLKSTARIVLGITVGASVTGDTISAVASALLPVAIMVVTLVALSLLVAWALTRWTRMDPATALCSSSPGALAAMVALADDLGGGLDLFGQLAHLVGDDGKTAAGFTGAGGLDGGIEGEQVGLIGDVVDQRDDFVDLHRAGVQLGNRGRKVLDVGIGRAHGGGDGFHLLQRALGEIQIVQR